MIKLPGYLLNEILDINAQDEFPTTTPRPKCERSPRENQLFSSDNFPGNYKKVLHTQLFIMTDWIFVFQDSNCLYRMKASTGKRVLLTFYMFDVSIVVYLFLLDIVLGIHIFTQMLLLNTPLTTHQLHPLKMENSI